MDLAGGRVRETLRRWSPQELGAFDVEFREALDRAANSFDLSEVTAVVARWRRTAALRSMPLSEAERQLVAAVRAGEEKGLYEQLADGTFRQLG